MEAMTDAEKKQRAELFIEKIAAKLPVKSTSESTVIGLFEGIVESLGKNPVRTAILADLDYFYGVFEVALTKKLEETQQSQSSSAVYKRDDVALKKIVNASFPAVKARMLLGTVDVNFVNSKIVEDDSSDETPNEKKELRILIAVQCAQLSAPQIALSILNSVSVIQPSVDSGNLSKALISRLAMRTNWCREETESSGCLWGYSMINAPHEMQKVAISTLSLLTGLQKDIWVFSMGFFGFWGLKCTTPVGEETLQLISDFLEGCSVNDSDDCEYSDIVLCLTVLYIWVNKLPKSVCRERTLSTLLVQLSTVSYKSRGSVQLFWSDALVPILESKLDLKTHNKKVKSFTNTSVNPLRDLLEWLGGVPGLVLGLGDAICDLLCEAGGDSGAIEGGEIGEITDETVEENTEMDVEIEKVESVNEKSKKRKLSIDHTAGEVGVRLGKKEVEKKVEVEEDDDEDDVDLGTFELDYSGNKEGSVVSESVGDSYSASKGQSERGEKGKDKGKESAKGVLNYLAETVEKPSKTSDPATPRISARNQNKIIAELEEKSAMELELENLPKISKPSKIPKKSISKKGSKEVIVESKLEIVQEDDSSSGMEEEILIAEKNISKEQTPKKSTKKDLLVETEKIENSEIVQKKIMSTKKSAKNSEIVEETEIVKQPKSTVKKNKKQEKAELMIEEEEEKVEIIAKKIPSAKSKKIGKVAMDMIGTSSENDDEASNVVIPLKTPKKSKKPKEIEEEEETAKLTENEFLEETPEKSVKIVNKKTKNSVTDSQVKKARK